MTTASQSRAASSAAGAGRPTLPRAAETSIGPPYPRTPRARDSDRTRWKHPEALAHLSHQDHVRGAGTRDARVAPVGIAAEFELHPPLHVDAVVLLRRLHKRRGPTGSSHPRSPRFSALFGADRANGIGPPLHRAMTPLSPYPSRGATHLHHVATHSFALSNSSISKTLSSPGIAQAKSRIAFETHSTPLTKASRFQTARFMSSTPIPVFTSAKNACGSRPSKYGRTKRTRAFPESIASFRAGSRTFS